MVIHPMYIYNILSGKLLRPCLNLEVPEHREPLAEGLHQSKAIIDESIDVSM